MIRSEVREEAEVIRLQGGEIPEVALYDSLTNLEANGLIPSSRELGVLQAAVVDRYQDIIRRDLAPTNISQSFFRGPLRARINLQRLKRFADRTGMDVAAFIPEASEMLRRYLAAEAEAVRAGRPYNTLGMSREQLTVFLRELGLADPEPGLIDRVCSVETLDFERAIQAARGEAPGGGDA